MTKRKFDENDEERSPIKRMCANPNLVRVRAEIPLMAILKRGSRKFWSTLKSQENEFQQVKCKVCEKLTPSDDDMYQSEPLRCYFCEKFMCLDCLISCDQCRNSFCSFCAVRVYNSNRDSGVCLSCERS